MKRWLVICALFCAYQAQAQERIFSIGYGKTFVTGDSSTISLTVDVNRVPGKSEGAGGYSIADGVFGGTQFGYYVQPMLDINLGSTTAAAPNNVAVGFPLGITYDIPSKKDPTQHGGTGPIVLNLDVTPELVSNRTFTNTLYYASTGLYGRWEFNEKKFLINLLTGAGMANGVRRQRAEKKTNDYSRVTFPFYVKFTCWNAGEKPIQGTAEKTKAFRRINLTNSIKYNLILADDETITPAPDYFFNSTKFDFYLTANFALNVTYNYGYEEPVFKKNHAVAFGVTLAR